jgi:predicted amidohydrolase YtcJ
MESMADRALGAYHGLASEDLLTVRLRGSLLVEPSASPADVGSLAEERARNTHPLFQTGSAKIFVDGVVEGETAYLLEPYAHRPDYRGELLWDPGHLNTMCAVLDKAGFQIHMHVIGDAATRIALDALEFAQQANGARDSRHLITHLQIVHPDDVPRFAQLGVVGVPQPFWFSVNPYYWNLELPYLGEERAGAEYPMQSFIDAGVVMASGSDFPVTVPFDPLAGIQTGITRSHPGQTIGPDVPLKDGDFGVLGPHERAGLADMIDSFTANGAYALFLEDEAGSLEVGKSADLVVLERNLFEIPVSDIHATRVLLTIFAGRTVYREAF